MTEEIKTPVPVVKTTEILSIDKTAGFVNVQEIFPQRTVVTKINKMMAALQKAEFLKQIISHEKQIAALKEKVATADAILEALK